MNDEKNNSGTMPQLLERVRVMLSHLPVKEKLMFGGVTLMLNNNMLCCISKKGLMIRVGEAAEAEALELPHARPCDGAGHRMSGFVMLDYLGLGDGSSLAAGLDMALRYVSALQPKENQSKFTSPQGAES